MPASVHSETNPNPLHRDVTVFEDPWPETRAATPLQDAANDHITLVGFFLRLLPHFPTGEGGVITDEALAYSEWRYVSYLRFLTQHGLSPHDRPPPWDVAILMYCHLMAPSSFQSHLWHHNHRAYGLEYRHFPLSSLLRLMKTGRWSDRQTQRDWDRWATAANVGYHLPYQLWESPPWEHVGFLSRLLRRQPKSQPPRKLTREKVKEPVAAPYVPRRTGSMGEEMPMATHIHQPRETHFPCSLKARYSDPRSWPLSDYARFRSGQIHRRCQSQSLHDSGTLPTCELAPWQCVSQLRTSIYRQAAFWNALHVAHQTQPSFFGNPTSSGVVAEYTAFLTLLRRPIPRVHGMSRFDPKAERLPSIDNDSRLIPPTLEIDLLWRTHRLFPGSYWLFCEENIGQLIDGQVAGGAARFAMDMTRVAWSAVGTMPWPEEGSPIQGWEDTYTPDVAVLGPPPDEATSLSFTLTGLLPRRKRRNTGKKPPSAHQRYTSSGGRSSFSSSSAGSPTSSSITDGWRRSRSIDGSSYTTTARPGTMGGPIRGSFEKSGGFLAGRLEDEKNWRISGVVL